MAEETPTPATTPTTPSTTPASDLSDAQTLYPAEPGTKTAAEAVGTPTEASPPAATLAAGGDAEVVDPNVPIIPKPDEVKADAPTPIDPASYVLTLPEGFAEDPALMTQARTLLAEAGVPADKAQGLVDLYVAGQSAASAQIQSALEARSAEWLTASNALPEFTGEMRKTSIASIGKAFDTFGDNDVREVFASTGVGNHPAVVRMFLKMSQALSEGAPSLPGRPAGQGGSPYRSTLYPDAQPKPN